MKKLKKKYLFLVMLVVLSSLLGPILVGSRAYADQNAEFIDKATIVIGDTVYFDKNPFDGTYEYVGNAVRADCYSTIKDFNDFEGDLKTARIYKRTLNTLKQCVDDGDEPVHLSATNNKFVTAYRIDDKTIFLPVWFYRHGSGTSTANLVNFTDEKKNGTYKRYPNDTTFCTDNNSEKIKDGKCVLFARFATDNGGTLDDISQTSSWVDMSENKIFARECNGSFIGIVPGNCTDDSWDLTFANDGEYTQPDSRAGYKINTSDANAGDKGQSGDTGQAGNAAVPKSCETSNPNVLLSWILCSVIGFIDDTMQKVVNSVDGLLDVKQDDYNQAGYKAIWSYVKNIADFLLVGAALVVIVGQAMKGE